MSDYKCQYQIDIAEVTLCASQGEAGAAQRRRAIARKSKDWRSLGKETTRGTLRAALDIIQKPAVEQGLLPV